MELRLITSACTALAAEIADDPRERRSRGGRKSRFQLRGSLRQWRFSSNGIVSHTAVSKINPSRCEARNICATIRTGTFHAKCGSSGIERSHAHACVHVRLGLETLVDAINPPGHLSVTVTNFFPVGCAPARVGGGQRKLSDGNSTEKRIITERGGSQSSFRPP